MRKLLLIIFLFLLTNVNAQWSLMNNGMGDKTVYSIVNGNYIFAGTDFTGGVYLSINGGLSWILTSLNNQNIFALAVNGNNVYAGSQQYGVYLSTNNGSTWAQTSLGNKWVTAVGATGSYVFAGVTFPDGVYVSPNYGTSWTQTTLVNRSVRSFALNGNTIFAGTYTYGVYLSINNGTTWTQTSLNNRSVSALTINGNDILAGTELGEYLSTNNGTTWSQTALNSAPVSSIAVNGNNIFAGTPYSGVYVSTNYGASWTQRNEGLTNFCEISLCIANPYIFAGTGCEMPRGVYRRFLSEFTAVQPVSNQIPKYYSLSQNYPNPFNPSTNFQFSIPKPGLVNITIYDALGRKVETLVNQELKPGTYKVDWSASAYPSGVYFYRLSAGDYTETKKMVLIK
jgi:hypothetical protein